MTPFWRIELLLALIIEFSIRAYHERRAVATRSAQAETETVVKRAAAVDWVAFVLGAMYYVSAAVLVIRPALLGFASMMLPGGLRFVGMGLQAAGLALLAWAHRALGVAFSKGSIPVGERLVTSGPYALMRHPLYVAVVTLTAGASLATLNAVPAALTAALAVTLVFRGRRESRLLAERFGETWQTWEGADADKP